MADRWWILLLNGLGAILFGVLAFAWPGVTLVVLVTLFGIYCIVDGFTAVWAARARRRGDRAWGWMLFVGIVSILAGIAAFLWPGLTAMALLFMIAAWAIVHGALEIIAAIELRKLIDNEWMLVLAGVVSVLFGILLVVHPGAGALGLVWLIGSFALVHGVLLVLLAFRLRRFGGGSGLARAG